jgi:alkylmercury lyase
LAAKKDWNLFMTNNITGVSERLSSGETGLAAWLWLPLITRLAEGDPVDVDDLVTATGRTRDDVLAALTAVPDTEYDASGRIIGQGLTLHATPHRFEVNGEQLYTWCALDTLIFPALLGHNARIESTHGSTGTPVHVSISPTGVTNVEPATAVVSLVNPDDMAQVRSSFCNEVHFFASSEEAQPWLDAHPSGSVIPVAEAFTLGFAIAQNILAEAHTAGDSTPTADTSCC